MNTIPLFSVIIPTYNRADRLLVALMSLENQTFKDFEVIVCDDGSTDNTREIASSFNNRLSLNYIWEENWGGPARPRNTGIKHAKGEWICFLDSDDYWYPEKLASCLPLLERSDFIYHHFDVVGRHVPGNQNKLFGRQLSIENAFMDLILNWNGIACSGVVIRKTIIAQAGFFDEDKSLNFGEDFEMWLRIARITNRFTLIPKALGGYYLSETSLSKNISNSIERDFLLLEKYRNDISFQQYVKVRALIHFIGGIRFLSNNDRESANHYFSLVINGKSNFFLKIKATFCMVLGKNAFTIHKLYNSMKDQLIMRR